MLDEESNYCCVNCFSEPEIQHFIEKSDMRGDCNYCGSEDTFVCEVSEVGDFVSEGIGRYYEDAANSVAYENAEGGYQLPTSDISEILIYEEQIFGDALEDPHPLVEDLMDPDGTPYVRRKPYGPESGGIEEISNWKEFCECVKHRQRFTVFLESENSKSQIEISNHRGFFDSLAEKLDDFIIELPPGTKIYRARLMHSHLELVHKELTSPEPSKTMNNRLSPVGISFFYGGMNPDVCIYEVRPSVGEDVAVAEFEVLSNLTVLDLAVEFDAPKSIFNEDYYFEYEEFLKPFLSHFITEIAKPIHKSDADVDYVPTQVFAEFIKLHRFGNRLRDGSSFASYHVNGIRFKSSLMKDGINIVLFRGPDISTELLPSKNDPWLLYKGVEQHKVTGTHL